MSFKKGDKVVCVDESIENPGIHFLYETWISVGEHYIIRNYNPTYDSVLLDGILNPPVYVDAIKGKMEPRFASERFKLLDELLDKIDISELNQ